MAKRPTFKRNPIPPPPEGQEVPAAPADVTKALGQMPLPKNKIIHSDNTRKNLELIGWEEGDPIPPELGKKVKALQDAMVASEEGHDPNKKLKRGREIDFSELSEAERAELSTVMVDYKQQMVAQAAQDAADRELLKNIPGADPSVVAAARAASEAANQHQPKMPEVELQYGDEPRQPVFTPESEPTPEPTPEPVPEPTRAEDEDEPHTHSAGLNSYPAYCPRCLWNMEATFEANPTDRDRQKFMAAMLGSTRFTKSYDIMGGTMRLSFRSLLSKESDLVFKQLNCDAIKEVITGDGDYFLRLEQYRTLCALEAVANADGVNIIEIPPVYEIEWDGDDSAGVIDNTRLHDLAGWFNAEITSESLRHITYQHYRQFQRLVEALETQAAEPDFWKGIEQPA